MAKLTYWVANCRDDSHVYSIRAKTRKEVVAKLTGDWNPASFEAPKKVTVEYNDAFDLMAQCFSEGTNWWECV